jgi:hypothetical protein
LPVLSPAYGIVVVVKDSVPDNAPGELDLRNNWGNHVLIQSDSGVFVLLAHLKQSSVRVKEGERVTPNTPLALCGNSGRSPQPHLHLQVQFHSGLGGSTVPFHLVSAIVRAKGRPPVFQLVARVGEGASVQRAEEDHSFSSAVHLPVGRTLRYRVTEADGAQSERLMCITVTLFGQFRLTTDRGASAAFEQRSGTLGFYDRLGSPDSLLDLWLLAMGLTPLSTIAESWEDSPPAALLPLGIRERLCVTLCRPLGAGIASRYERHRLDIDGCWIQSGSHELRLPGVTARAKTRVRVSPESGCVSLEFDQNGTRIHAELIATGQVADRGVPAWEQAVHAARHPDAQVEA